MITEKSYAKMSCCVYDGILTIFSISVGCTNVFMICVPVLLTYESADPLPLPLTSGKKMIQDLSSKFHNF